MKSIDAMRITISIHETNTFWPGSGRHSINHGCDPYARLVTRFVTSRLWTRDPDCRSTPRTRAFHSQKIKPERIMEESNHVDVCIVGGGICGILAAQGCVERGLSFVVLEQGEALGGCWQTLANSYSTLQVRQSYGTLTRWHEAAQPYS